MSTDSEWRRDRIRLTLPNDLAYLRVARSTVRAAARPYGYSTSELDNWEAVIEETMSNVVTFAYAAGERASFDIDCLLEPNGLTVLIRDHGKPFDPERIKPVEFAVDHPDRPARGLGWHLIHRLMDVVAVESLGREGKQLSLFKAAPHRLPTRPKRKSATADPTVEASGVVCRAATTDDAIEIIRLFYDCYRYSYFNEQIYNLQGLRRMIANRDIESFVAASSGGRILAHSALIHYADRPKAVECGMAVAKPADRGHHVSERLAKLVDEGVALGGKPVLFTGCVTVHVAAQKIAVQSGLSECGLMLGAVPSETFIALKREERNRGTILFLASLRAARPPPALVLPPGHEDFIAGLYAQCGIPFTRGKRGSAAKGESDITTSVRPKIGAVRAVVHRIGDDLIGLIKAMMHAARRNRAEVGQLFLPLTDRALPDTVAALEPLGWFVTGILPEGAPAGDALLMHWLNGWALDYDSIKLARPQGQQLLTAVRARDPEQQ
jgi:serine/threonine-protein kinase RsbW